MAKKILNMVLFTSILLFAFGVSYYLTLHKMEAIKENEKQKVTVPEVRRERAVLRANNDELVKPNAKIIFKVEYKKSGDIKIEKTEKADALVNKDKEELENLYGEEGYKVEAITPDEVVLMKKIDSYSPNKYIIGIKDEYIAIYKTDENGKPSLEKVSEYKVKDQKQGDIDFLVNGSKDYQFESSEDAMAGIVDYFVR